MFLLSCFTSFSWIYMLYYLKFRQAQSSKGHGELSHQSLVTRPKGHFFLCRLCQSSQEKIQSLNYKICSLLCLIFFFLSMFSLKSQRWNGSSSFLLLIILLNYQDGLDDGRELFLLILMEVWLPDFFLENKFSKFFKLFLTMDLICHEGKL